jgi:NAD(P)-dependent dehydrogenase (short-subunit alcohol dehydrogenase family)
MDSMKQISLITGAGGLLGYEHAFALLELGHTVLLTDVELGKLNKVKTRLTMNFPPDLILTRLHDVSSKNSSETLLSDIETRGFEIDVLVNNAAINPVFGGRDETLKGKFEEYPELTFESEFNVGLKGAIYCCQVFGGEMYKRKKGLIVNVASDLSVIAPDQRIYRNPNSGVQTMFKPFSYSVIKAGLVGLTKYLATYWADGNIRVNAISPGGVEDGQESWFKENLTSKIPLGRMANREEYRGAIKFLCSDASSYMTGQNLVIDGGRSIW